MKAVKFISTIILFLILSFHTSVKAQDIESITKKTPVSLSGNINLNSGFYSVKGITPRRTPYFWSAYGNMNLQLYGISIPISLGFQNQNLSFGHPFHEYGATPYYKWVKVHAGWNSIKFSPYTMSGKKFLGVGVELTPGKFRFAAIYGTLRNELAYADTLVYGATLIPSYKRKVYGGRIGVGTDKNHVDLIFLKAWDVDDPNVFSTYSSDIDLRPKQNNIFGTDMSFLVFKKITFTSNFSISAFNNNTSFELDIPDSVAVPSIVESVPQRFLLSRFSYAGDAQVSFKIKKQRFGVKYKRVAPFYETLTSNYLYNDYHDLSVNANITIKTKLRSRLSIGVRENNLSGYKTSTSKNIIGMANVSYTPSKFLSFNANYSNFNNETSGALLLNDTLRFITVNSSYGLQGRYLIELTDKKLDFNFGGNNQVVEDRSEIRRMQSDINNLSFNLGSGLRWNESKLRLGIKGRFSIFNNADFLQNRTGVTLSARRPFLDKKVKIRYSVSYDINKSENVITSNVISNRISVNLKLKKKHSFNVGLNHMAKSSEISNSFNEFTGIFGYSFSFNTNKKTKK